MRLNHMPALVDRIIAYEYGDLTFEQSVELFQQLYDTGVINELQGSYGRTMAQLILDGLIDTEEAVPTAREEVT
jgi:hypothetical protein